jgi:hypothetical protein
MRLAGPVPCREVAWTALLLAHAGGARGRTISHEAGRFQRTIECGTPGGQRVCRWTNCASR